MIGLVIIALTVALAIFMLRHRRIQRSFLSFASSHYNTRSAFATFSANDGLGMQSIILFVNSISDLS
jgi:hypothetical protein